MVVVCSDTLARYLVVANRTALLAIALIAFLLAPILSCCGAQAATGDAAPMSASHDCGHGRTVTPEPTQNDHADCDGCEDCAPGARDVVQPPKTADVAVSVLPSAAEVDWPVEAAMVPVRFLRPPSTAPPRTDPIRLHTKITV